MNKLTNILSLIIAVFGLHHTLTAHPVDLQTAQSVAVKFMGVNEAQLVSTYRTDKNAAAFYVFNTEDGFIIVSADDCETPIIGYSREGRFDPNNVPAQMEDYLQDFVARIQYGIENHIEADELTAKQWELVKVTGRLNESRSSKSVEPLLTEMWEQGCHYNELCPTFSKVPCGHAEVGCVAVAMGQIMHYWRYPETGWGSHSYSNIGIQLSADFGNTTYDWEHMPDSLTEASSQTEIEAVATLLYHCGISVNMSYTTNGSSAESGDVPEALYRYFSYSRRLHIEKRSDYTDEEWMSILKACLDLQQPIYYGGKGSVGRHAFVCDGYDDNDLLHFNWGWGRANGYFALGHLNPIGTSFNENNFAILDIYPQYEPCVVVTTAYPAMAGTIEGAGEYHIGDLCTLTATPTEDYEFNYWKINGQTVSNTSSYTFIVEADSVNVEANFEPCVVVATAYPAMAGTIEGAGEYHFGDLCTLTAIPTEDYVFNYWKINGQTVSYTPSYTFVVEADSLNIEAYFSCLRVEQLTVSYSPEASNPNSPSVCLSWNLADTEWKLLKQIETDEVCSGVVTDGEHIYVTYGEWNSPQWNSPHFAFGKYTMDGDLVEQFNLENNFNALSLAYDGTNFYCNSGYPGLGTLYTIDLKNKMIIDSTDMGFYFYSLAYDPEYDGFWLGKVKQTILCNRQGERIKTSPTIPNYSDYIYGSAYFTARDGTPHLLLSTGNGVFDYDITNNSIIDRPLLNPNWDYTLENGAYAGKYSGKDAMYIAFDHCIRIYEIKTRFGQIVNYRIYRADSEGHSVMLADEVLGTSFLDSSWNDALAGTYRFGISEVYTNGVESEIIWSDPIVKTDFSIDENDSDQEDAEPSVQKVIENGHIIIIKDGNRYNVSGQKLN